MTRWTVRVGDADLVIEKLSGGLVTLEITPPGVLVRADRQTIEDIRLKLGAAIADPGTNR